MSKKLIHLISFVLVLGLALTSTASAELIAWWKFDDGGGTTAADSSGNGYDGTLNGDATWAAGQLGGALQLDGSGDYVTCGLIDIDTTVTGGLTVCAWINKPAGGDMKFCSNRQNQNAAGGGFTCTIYNDRMEMDLSNATARSLNRDSDGPTVAAGTWVHVAWVYDDVADTFNEYHDGVLADSSTENVSIGVSTQEFRIGADAPSLSHYVNGLINDLRIYDHALSESEILDAMAGRGPQAERAADPIPEDEATDVIREITLSWTPGEFAGQHDVYFDTSFDDVNNATNLDPMGPDDVYRARQDADSYAVGERLDLGKTYYWRIDEVNAPPTSHVVFKGEVWSFTVEPFAYPIDGQNITATASSSFNAGTGPENTVNGSGLGDDDLHSAEQADVWLTSMTAQPPIWIQYEFDRVYKLHEMWIWNFNQVFESVVGFGLKDVTIEYSANGANWAQLAGVPEFAQAPGMPGYAHNTTVDFGGAAVKYVKITANDNWGFLNQHGLSEVRFFYVPVLASQPNPDSGATNVGLDATLGFKAGREAAKHDVYLSTDEQAVIGGTAPVTTVGQASHGPLSLDLGQTYYWRVDEVNEAETPTTWQGDIWNFATQEYLVLEDFEAYDDYEPNRPFDTWTDGWGVPTNGSTIGFPNPIFVLGEHFVETTIVHSGSQSTPLFYDNTAGATYSEATRAVDSPRDWTKASAKALTLWFHGDPNNSVTEQMYVKVNGSKVIYDGDADNITRAGWQMWYIELADFGVNLSNVTELTIGLERIGAAGGTGVVYFDDIRLFPYDRQLVTPVEPDTAGLAVHYEFEGTTGDSSGNGLHGTAVGEPVFVAGKIGQAISLDGIDDYVEITGYKGINAVDGVQQEFSIANWFRITETSGDHEMVTWGTNTGTQRLTWRVHEGRLRTEHGSGNLRGNTYVNDGQWHHGALVVTEGANLRVPATRLYVDGVEDTVFSGSDNAYNLTADVDVRIGMGGPSGDRFFPGSIDDVRIYERVLTEGEIASLAGRTKPFDRPF